MRYARNIKVITKLFPEKHSRYLNNILLQGNSFEWLSEWLKMDVMIVFWCKSNYRLFSYVIYLTYEIPIPV